MAGKLQLKFWLILLHLIDILPWVSVDFQRKSANPEGEKVGAICDRPPNLPTRATAGRPYGANPEESHKLDRPPLRGGWLALARDWGSFRI